MRSAALVLAAVLVCGLPQLSIAQAPSPSPAADPNAWMQPFGIADLADAILARVDLAVERHGMSPEQAASIRAQVAQVRRDEAAWRAAREEPRSTFDGLMARLRTLGATVSWVPPRRPLVPAPTADWTLVPSLKPLDLRGFKPTFADEFDRPSITPDGGAGPWFAPVHSDFGAAKFEPPGPTGPFFYRRSAVAKTPSERSLLEIHARRTPEGWRSGLAQTVDGRGRGFAQTYGYFEMRAKLPLGKATWPAFWLLTQNAYLDKYQDKGEIDVLEHYGTDPHRLHVAVHLRPPNSWHAGGFQGHWYRSNKIPIPDLREGFHQYGVLVDPKWITIYYDRRAVTRFPTQDAYRTPLYMLIDLTMHPREIEAADNPSVLMIDYVRAWTLPARMLTDRPMP
jgi:hypothetical protein